MDSTESREMPYRKGKGEIAEGLEWKTAEWTGEEGGMTAKVSVISGIVSPGCLYGWSRVSVFHAGNFAVECRRRGAVAAATHESPQTAFFPFPPLSFFVLIKLGGEKNISATVHLPFLEGDIDSSFELFVIRFG